MFEGGSFEEIAQRLQEPGQEAEPMVLVYHGVSSWSGGQLEGERQGKSVAVSDMSIFLPQQHASPRGLV